MEANGINYYKGVLLCSRPNQNPSTNTKRQFCGRVFAHDQLGLVPVKAYNQKKTKKRVLPVLNNHKKWLQKFKKDVHQQKQQEVIEQQKIAKRLEKIKQEGYAERQKLKNSAAETQVEDTSQNKQNTNPQNNAHKKKQKPAWAQTAEQAEQSNQKQVDQLLDFFNNENQEELKDYISDAQVKNILVDLKTKIEKLKEQEDWKNKQMQKIEEDRTKAKDQNGNDKDDILSRISKQSGAQSVASQKTAERVEELEKKKKEVEWDKLTASEKKSMASVDQQIAKNIADEVLRNYPALKHHSNQSIRQLLEKQAHDQLKA